MFDVILMAGVDGAKSIVELSLEFLCGFYGLQYVKSQSKAIDILFVVVFLDFSQNSGTHAIGADFIHAIGHNIGGTQALI